jgi:hypothetical protein
MAPAFTSEDLYYYHREFGALFDVYGKKHPTWGCLHVILEDGNPATRSSIEWCQSYAIDNKDYLGAFLCDVLLLFTDTQLRRLTEDELWQDLPMSEVLLIVSADISISPSPITITEEQ